VDTTAFLHHLQGQASYQGQIVHCEHISYRDASYAELDEPLAPELEDCLARQGLSRLYAHQAEAVNYARQGSNVMVATSSASGKTLCYTIAVMEAILTERGSRALYLFPTKALAQDQLRSLHQLFCPGLCRGEDFATFDGDTPRAERAEIRKRARVVLRHAARWHLAQSSVVGGVPAPPEVRGD